MTKGRTSRRLRQGQLTGMSQFITRMTRILTRAVAMTRKGYPGGGDRSPEVRSLLMATIVLHHMHFRGLRGAAASPTTWTLRS